MKNNIHIKELFASAVFIILLGIFLNPLYMPSSYTMMLVLALIIVFAFFATYVWQEKARDEREGYHRLLAGRNAFLAGTAVLVLGIIIQSFDHAVDPWLVITLGVMILAKMAGILKARSKH